MMDIIMKTLWVISGIILIIMFIIWIRDVYRL